jgi:hypothetical protein
VAYIIQREEQRKQGNTFGFKIWQGITEGPGPFSEGQY